MNICYQIAFTFKIKVKTDYNSICGCITRQHPKFNNCGAYITKCESEHSITLTKFIYVWEENKEKAKEVAKKEFEAFLIEKEYKLVSGYIMHTREDYVIDTSNGHNKDLVDKINFLWARVREIFKPIIHSLYLRDEQEANDKGIELSLYEENFDSFAYEFMMNVCDDADLKVIINFIRYSERVSENSKLVRTLYHDGWIEC